MNMNSCQGMNVGTSGNLPATIEPGQRPSSTEPEGQEAFSVTGEVTSAGGTWRPSLVLTSYSDPCGRTYVPWGMLAAIDLHGCERSRLEDPDTLRRFVPSLIDAIGMRAHGPLALDRFGDGELEGWSAMQFIETSSITVHADEVSARCFVDIFSCRLFDSEVAAAIAVAHFGGTLTLTVLHR
jgi:S-adenosylmethionine decarboxylase